MSTSLLQPIDVIDSHTAGEPTRVVIAGGPDLGGGTLADLRLRVMNEHRGFLAATVNEPRGSDVLVGALLVPPSETNCAAGVIFFNNVGVLQMCGHGLIGVVATLAHLKRIGPGEHRIDTPVGVVTAALATNGEVSFENVPSHRLAKDARFSVSGLGTVTGDIAWGGNWFFLGHVPKPVIELTAVDELTEIAWKIRQAVNSQGYPQVDHIELVSNGLNRPSVPGEKRGRGFVLCPGKAYDRSPCGTGTSAKLACLAADGMLAPGETWVQESVLGTEFRGSYRWAYDARSAIIPTVRGKAWVTAESRLLVDPGDPFAWGITPQTVAGAK